jgi:hypothetical protein
VDAEIADRPADWRDHEIAKRRFHIRWCSENGLPPQACESPVDAVQSANRKKWCAKNGIADDCEGSFKRLDDEFEREWRQERDAEIANIHKPDLRRPDLRGADARGAFLAGVDLREARLEGANLSTRLEDEALREALQKGVDIIGARLQGANLRFARLQGANLSFARLEGADLIEVRLQGADLRRAGDERTK